MGPIYQHTCVMRFLLQDASDMETCYDVVNCRLRVKS